jgi:hypothetical protein
MGREPERAGGHRFVIRQCRRANDNVTTRALNLDFLCAISEHGGCTEKNLKLRHCPRTLLFRKTRSRLYKPISS